MELTQILQKALEIGGSDIFLIPWNSSGKACRLTEATLQLC